MPIYEYQCSACDHIFDALQKMSDDVLKDCPDCGKPELRKLLSAPNFRLKGSGWYETDFKKDKQRNLAGDAGEAKPAKDGADKKKDSKSDGKAVKSESKSDIKSDIKSSGTSNSDKKGKS